MDRWWFEKELLRFSHVKGSANGAFRRVEPNFERPPQEKTTWKAPQYTHWTEIDSSAARL